MRNLVRVLAILIAVQCSPAHAAASTVHRIRFDAGGAIFMYIMKYVGIQEARERVIIDGACISACTLILGLVDADRVCVTPRAFLAFHSAATGDGQFHHEATRLIWRMYPPRIRAMLLKRGWDGDANVPHPQLIYIEGDELLTIYHRCTPEEAAEQPATS